jgi:hypothetical protein
MGESRLSKPSELIPNSFQVPNFLVDKLLCHLSGPQAEVLMLLCRKTFGWNKREDVISFGQFRKEAGVSRSAVVEALNDFVASGLVRKIKHGTLELKHRSRSCECSGPAEFKRADSPHSGPTETQVNPKPKSKSSDEAPSPIEEVWEYYREKLKRSPHLELTKQRRTMGEAGLKACEEFALMRGSVTPFEDAIALMKLAIDRLAESPFHNGQNGTGPKYLEWEVLFRGRNVPSPQKLTEYWLNDEKFPDSARGIA